MTKLFTLLVLSMLLAGCDSATVDDNNGNNSDTQQTSELAGNVYQSCHQFSAADTSTQERYVFTETEFISTYNTYSNDGCFGTPDTSNEMWSGIYTLGNKVVSSGGYDVTEIDFLITSSAGDPHHPVDQYTLYDIYSVVNDTLYFGISRYRTAEERENTISFNTAYVQE